MGYIVRILLCRLTKQILVSLLCCSFCVFKIPSQDRYTFDKLDRLKEANGELFSYDSAGNRTDYIRINPMTIDSLEDRRSFTTSTQYEFRLHHPSLPNNNLIFRAKFADRTLIKDHTFTAHPSSDTVFLNMSAMPNASGTSKVTVLVNDGTLTLAKTISFTIVPVASAPPVLSGLDDLETRVAYQGNKIVIPIVIQDPDTPLDHLLITAESNRPDVVPKTGVTIGGLDEKRTLTISPVATKAETVIITFRISDGANEILKNLIVRFLPGPYISEIQNQTISRDSGLRVRFSLLNLQTEASLTQLKALAENPRLFPEGSMEFAKSGAEWLLLMRPELHETGSSTVTISYADGVGTATKSFELVVKELRGPTMSAFAAQQFLAEDSTLVIPFTVADPDTPVDNLKLTATSSNEAVVQSANISFSGTGTNRVVTIIPALNQSGTTTITVIVSDGDHSAVGGFGLVVAPVNDPPVLSGVNDLDNFEVKRGRQLVISAKLFDVDSAVTDLVLTAGSNNERILADLDITIVGSGEDWKVAMTPTREAGTAIVTLRATDGISSRPTSIIVRVLPSEPPSVSPISSQSIQYNGEFSLIFTVKAFEGREISEIKIIASNAELFPEGSIIVSGVGTNRILTLTPAPNSAGSSRITVKVSDGISRAEQSFDIIVAEPATPTISLLEDQSTQEDVPLKLNVSVDDTDTPLGNLILSATSSNEALVSTKGILFGGGSKERTVTITPKENQSGLSLINIRVSDGVRSASTGFVLTVDPVNDAPVLTGVADSAYFEVKRGESFSIPLVVSDVETPSRSLVLSAKSNHENIIGPQDIVWSGVESNRTVTITATRDTGPAILTFVLSDGEAMVPTSIIVSVVKPAEPSGPLISVFDPNQVTDEDTPLTFPFTVDDPDTPLNELILTPTSSNPSVITTSGIIFSGIDKNRTITLKPIPNKFGSSIINVEVSDGQHKANSGFVLMVNPVNDPPTLSGINELDRFEIQQGSELKLHFSVQDEETAALDLSVTSKSGNEAVVENSDIILGGTDENRVVSIIPTMKKSGVSIITLKVSDNATYAIRNFIVDVIESEKSARIIIVPGSISWTGSPALVSFVVEGELGSILVAERSGDLRNWEPFSTNTLAGVEGLKLVAPTLNLEKAAFFRMRLLKGTDVAE